MGPGVDFAARGRVHNVRVASGEIECGVESK